MITVVYSAPMRGPAVREGQIASQSLTCWRNIAGQTGPAGRSCLPPARRRVRWNVGRLWILGVLCIGLPSEPKGRPCQGAHSNALDACGDPRHTVRLKHQAGGGQVRDRALEAVEDHRLEGVELELPGLRGERITRSMCPGAPFDVVTANHNTVSNGALGPCGRVPRIRALPHTNRSRGCAELG